MTQAEERSAVEREQRAFDQRLESMLQEHPDQFVVFKDEQPIEFFDTYGDAYRFAIDRFGLNEAFLVSEVKRRELQTTSVSWEAGVMF